LSGERGVLRALNLTAGLVGQVAEQKCCSTFASQFGLHTVLRGPRDSRLGFATAIGPAFTVSEGPLPARDLFLF